MRRKKRAGAEKNNLPNKKVAKTSLSEGNNPAIEPEPLKNQNHDCGKKYGSLELELSETKNRKVGHRKVREVTRMGVT